MKDRIVIGLTGPFGSGCSYLAREHIVPCGYEYISLSDILREECSKRWPDENISDRSNLQNLGNRTRKENHYNFLAELASQKIIDSDNKCFVVDSIRNTAEIELLKNIEGRFFLLATWADEETRWKRVEDIYKGNRQNFAIDEKRDRDEELEEGQQVSLCYKLADIVVINNKKLHKNNTDYITQKALIEKYLKIIKGEIPYVPNEMESLMAVAYATSMRSSCFKRKVGAILVDDEGNVFSSGYNEVPSSSSSCKSEYAECYRSIIRKDFAKKVVEVIEEQEKAETIITEFNKAFKVLEYCRALHAEENAILNVARNGSSMSLKSSKLYTTTFPCNLCANKISEVGIAQIIYSEPYPQKEAKDILDSKEVKQKQFYGITHYGYFRLMEVVK